jgi:hypothetical protein
VSRVQRPLHYLVTLAVTAALLGGLFVATFDGDVGISDTGVYQRYGEAIAAQEVPYRDFAVEYPPGSLLPFVLPALVTSTREAYDAVFLVLMLAALAAASALVVVVLRALGTSDRRSALSVAALLAGVALLGPFLLTRFDLYAVTVTLAALAAVLHGHRRLGPVLLGLAIATKIYPAVLVPLLVARAWRREGRREGIRTLALAAGTAALVYLPFAVVAPDGVARSLWRQAGRPLQIESLGSSVLLVLHNALGMPLGWADGAGSQNLTGSVATAASIVTAVAGTAALALVWVRFARGDASADARFVRFAAAAVVAFVAFGKVLSPQFLVWLLAAVVVVAGRRGSVALALVLAACALTRLWFPRTYWDLVKQFDPTASWLVFARDLVLVALFAVLVARMPRAAATTDVAFRVEHSERPH